MAFSLFEKFKNGRKIKKFLVRQISFSLSRLSECFVSLAKWLAVRKTPRNKSFFFFCCKFTLVNLCQNYHNYLMLAKSLKPVEGVASSRKDMKAMPESVQDTFGFALSCSAW